MKILPGLLLAAMPLLVFGAEPVRQDTTDLQPAVNTSPGLTAPAPGAAAPPATPTARVKAKAAAAPVPKRAAQDRLELQATQITGNRELPRVMYVVPWKRPDPGDLSGRPANSLLDEVLAPVDRDVFQRQSRYYNDLKPDGAPSAARPEDEK
jgi:hypothetical protein